MTAKEFQRMRRLEIENAELRAKVLTTARVYGQCIVEICELKAKIALVDPALHDAEQE
jgi:hypothetical protein